MAKFRKIKRHTSEVEPDEIFLDSQNIPDFNVQQFEGRLEKPISKRIIIFLGIFFVLTLFILFGKAMALQIWEGDKYSSISQNISLEREIIFAERGIIYDRNNKPLGWNEASDNDTPYSKRVYIKEPGFSHVLGYISYPIKDKQGFYWQKDFIGKDGIEKKFNSILSGKNGEKLREVNVRGEVQSENVIYKPEAGENIVLSINWRLQKEFYNSIKKLAENASFRAGSGIIMDTENGEIIVMTNYPEYDPNSFLAGDDEKITKFLSDENKPLLNRAIAGLYTPGSIVKPYIAIGALNESIIDPSKKILSTGSISIPNQYFPNLKSVFHDWKAHGWVDMREALAVSSNVYFYEVGGGFEGQIGLGIEKILKYVKFFGLGNKTGIDLPGEIGGIVPSPDWKKKNFNGEPWRVGDTYNTTIGQYGFQVTPIQMVRAVAAMANNGKLLKPKIVMGKNESERLTVKGSTIDSEFQHGVEIPTAMAMSESTEQIDIDESYYKVIHEGMRKAVISGTATKLDAPFVKIAAKTGSAQLGVKKQFINSWITGFFPYDKPKYAFVVLMERGPSQAGIFSAANAMKDLIWWMSENTPEYFEINDQQLTTNN